MLKMTLDNVETFGCTDCDPSLTFGDEAVDGEFDVASASSTPLVLQPFARWRNRAVRLRRSRSGAQRSVIDDGDTSGKGEGFGVRLNGKGAASLHRHWSFQIANSSTRRFGTGTDTTPAADRGLM
jgi:hypothetical protein